MTTISYFISAALALLFGAVQAAPAWTPAPGLTVKLAPPVKEAGYQVRPPRGYKALPVITDEMIDLAWSTSDQPDGIPTFLAFDIIPSVPNEQKKTLSQELATMTVSEKDRYKNYKTTPVQKGMIHGIPFLRFSWTGIDKKDGLKMEGFWYIGLSGDTTYDFYAVGSASFFTKLQYELAEASVLTFQKK